MSFLKFKDKKNPVEAQAKRISQNRVEISGCAINTSGFLCYQDVAMTRLFGDYTAFTTLYQEKDESFILSNDGSVYPEDPEDTKPTLREEVEALKQSFAAFSANAENMQENISEVREAVGYLQDDMRAINEAMEV